MRNKLIIWMLVIVLLVGLLKADQVYVDSSGNVLEQDEYNRLEAIDGGLVAGFDPKERTQAPAQSADYQMKIKSGSNEVIKYGTEQELNDYAKSVQGISGVTTSSVTKVPTYKARDAELGTPISKITDHPVTSGKNKIDNNLVIYSADGSTVTKITKTNNQGEIISTKELRDDVEVTSFTNGPMTLTHEGETITIPEGNNVDINDIGSGTFQALSALNEKIGGIPEDVEIDYSSKSVQSGNTFAQALGQTTSVMELTSPDADAWTEVTEKIRVRTDKKGNPVYNYASYECQGSCSIDNQGRFIGQYTAEGRGPDNYHTKWVERNQNGVKTRTEMEWNSNYNAYAVESVEVNGNKENFYGDLYVSTGYELWGRPNYYMDVDGELVEIEYDEAQQAFVHEDNVLHMDKEILDIIDQDTLKAQHGSKFNWFGDMIKKWSSATAGYPGISLLYDEPDPIIDIDQQMAQLLGGIDGWTSAICEDEMTQSVDSGSAFSTNIVGAYAHVEGERITSMNFDNSTSENMYKVSLSVDPGNQYRGCNIKFHVSMQGDGTKYISVGEGNVSLAASPHDFQVNKGGSPVSYTGSNMLFFTSDKSYSQVCIKFLEIVPEFYPGGEGCLIGVVPEDEICNSLMDRGTETLGDDPCEGDFMYINPLCWG